MTLGAGSRVPETETLSRPGVPPCNLRAGAASPNSPSAPVSPGSASASAYASECASARVRNSVPDPRNDLYPIRNMRAGTAWHAHVVRPLLHTTYYCLGSVAACILGMNTNEHAKVRRRTLCRTAQPVGYAIGPVTAPPASLRTSTRTRTTARCQVSACAATRREPSLGDCDRTCSRTLCSDIVPV